MSNLLSSNPDPFQSPYGLDNMSSKFINQEEYKNAILDDPYYNTKYYNTINPIAFPWHFENQRSYKLKTERDMRFETIEDIEEHIEELVDWQSNPVLSRELKDIESVVHVYFRSSTQDTITWDVDICWKGVTDKFENSNQAEEHCSNLLKAIENHAAAFCFDGMIKFKELESDYSHFMLQSQDQQNLWNKFKNY